LVGKGNFGYVFKANKKENLNEFFALKRIVKTKCDEGVN